MDWAELDEEHLRPPSRELRRKASMSQARYELTCPPDAAAQSHRELTWELYGRSPLGRRVARAAGSAAGLGRQMASASVDQTTWRRGPEGSSPRLARNLASCSRVLYANAATPVLPAAREWAPLGR